MGNLDCIADRENVQIAGDYALIPEGVYLAQVISSETVPTQKGGVMLKLEHVLLAPEYSGRIVRTNLNVVCTNEQAQKIGIGQLGALAYACGYPKGHIPGDSPQLHDKPHAVKIVITVSKDINPNTGQLYSPRNEIKAFYPKDKIPKPSVKHAGEPNFVNNDLPEFLK